MSNTRAISPGFGYVPQLDGLRAIAILLVLIGHVLLHTRYEQVAAIGVLVFFVMSGYLITSLLLHEERAGKVSIPAFFVRRALRILPAMYVFLGAVLALVRMRVVNDTGWVSFVASLVYLRNIFGRGGTLAHLWSLSLEEQFYFIWPFLFTLIGETRRRLTLCLAVVALVACWRAIAISLHLFDYNVGIYYERTDFRIDSILVGCAVAFAFNLESAEVSTALRRLRNVPPAGALLALVALSVVPPVAFIRPFLITIETVIAACVVASVAYGKAPAAMNGWFAVWLGRLSYSIYLWQQLFTVTNPFSNSVPVQLVLSVCCAATSHYCVERPFLRLKQKYSASRPAGMKTATIVATSPR